MQISRIIDFLHTPCNPSHFPEQSTSKTPLVNNVNRKMQSIGSFDRDQTRNLQLGREENNHYSNPFCWYLNIYLEKVANFDYQMISEWNKSTNQNHPESMLGGTAKDEQNSSAQLACTWLSFGHLWAMLWNV